MGTYDELVKSGTEFSLLLDQAGDVEEGEKKVSTYSKPSIFLFNRGLEHLPENSFQHYLDYIAEQDFEMQPNKNVKTETYVDFFTTTYFYARKFLRY